MPCPEPLYKNSSALGLAKITVIIKTVVEAFLLPCVSVSIGFCDAHYFEPVQTVTDLKI
jgi:hypothetical protein